MLIRKICGGPPATLRARYLIELTVDRTGRHFGDDHPGAGEIRTERLAEGVDEVLAAYVRGSGG